MVARGHNLPDIHLSVAGDAKVATEEATKDEAQVPNSGNHTAPGFNKVPTAPPPVPESPELPVSEKVGAPRRSSVKLGGSASVVAIRAQADGPPWKIILFTVNLLAGLVVSQVTAAMMDKHTYFIWTEIVQPLTMICLCYIMISVGMEFVIEKSNVRQYVDDYLIAMTAAGFPWIFVAVYFMYALPYPLEYDSALLAARFAAPTSAGILFSMLEAAGLKETWLFRKARVLAIFDDVDTILLMIPLKIIIVGAQWELGLVVVIMVALLSVAWFKLHAVPLPYTWKWIMFYAVLITAVCEAIYVSTCDHIAEMTEVHLEVLLPAFCLGCIIKTSHSEAIMRAEASRRGESSEGGTQVAPAHSDDAAHAEDEAVGTIISAVFMVLVGLSMPALFGGDNAGHHACGEQGGSGSGSGSGLLAASGGAGSLTAAVSDGVNLTTGSTTEEAYGGMAAGPLVGHVIAVSILLIVGKMFPLCCYRDEAPLRTRLALSLGMCPRGEVGAGVIVISLGLGIGQGTARDAMTIAVLSLAVNLAMSGLFIMSVKKLAADDPVAGIIGAEAAKKKAAAAAAAADFTFPPAGKEMQDLDAKAQEMPPWLQPIAPAILSDNVASTAELYRGASQHGLMRQSFRQVSVTSAELRQEEKRDTDAASDSLGGIKVYPPKEGFSPAGPATKKGGPTEDAPSPDSLGGIKVYPSKEGFSPAGPATKKGGPTEDDAAEID